MSKEVSELGKDQGLSLTYKGVLTPVHALARAYVLALPNSVLSSNRAVRATVIYWFSKREGRSRPFNFKKQRITLKLNFLECR